jgi:hypothetical protein
MELWQKQALCAENVGLLLAYIRKQGFYCTLGDAFRSTEQAALDAQKGIGIKNSLHCQRLAIDLNLFDAQGHYLEGNDSYKQFGEFWKTLNPANRWGGDFTRGDGNHFEMQDL